MVRLRLALVTALGVLLLAPQAAAGGGWWSSIDVTRSPVAAGQRVEVKASVLFNSVAAAEAARQPGRYRVYLLRGFDDSPVERAMRKASPREWWSLGAAQAIEVGPVAVRVLDANFGRARAAFTVPELAAGSYHLMLCTAGCAEPLADVIPAEDFTIVADPATAQLTKRVDRLARRSRKQARQLVAGRDARSEVDQLRLRLASMANDDQSPPPATGWAYAGWLLAGALAGALAVLVLRRRSRPPRAARVVPWHPSDEELRELLSSESRDPRAAP
jgi:hypothetical protein